MALMLPITALPQGRGKAELTTPAGAVTIDYGRPTSSRDRVSDQKVGDVWLPLRDESVSQLLLFGKSSLTITYSDYQIQVRESSDSAAK